ncbi:ATP-binding protein [Aggregatilinea lenta]|uniref:ATP-binding protein n=1 Tax=Aggregatilinea lenta TaxID=913108 RepID=UPI0013C2B082|nr:ATP-binding protein [Aggregatilinea lenta]
MITGNATLDWALISVSLFNAILLLWLGLIVLFNAERRTWGVLLLDGGLLLGALFFVSHTVMLGHEMTTTVSWGLNFWWQIGWFPVILAPYLWHVTVLWYTGFWERGSTSLRRRHLAGLVVTSVLALGLVFLMLLAHALPTYTQIAYRNVADVPALRGIPLLFLLYPPFAFLSVVLPIDALYRPEPSARMMGDLARRRARSWLIATSLVLLAVGAAITAFFAWALNGYRMIGGVYFGWENEIASFDLVLSTLIAGGILMLGQAIVSYEIFTGKALPRRGFFRHWRSIILLAAGYATLASWTLIYEPRPIYSVLLAALLVIVFYALFSWRSFVEREQFMARLRPFVSSQRLVNGFLDSSDRPGSSAAALFEVICADVLGATRARLIPLGALAPLAGQPLAYACAPDDPPVPLPRALFDDPQAGVLPLDASQSAGLEWAVPLWSERGLIGVLLLGPKQDGGLYTQEEIEIARAGAERIIDTLAGEQIARRLTDIQRRRLAETRVLDLRTRRALHDEILPELHRVALELSALPSSEPGTGDILRSLTQIHHQISDLIHTSGGVFVSNGQGGSLAQSLLALVEGEFADAFTSITWRADDPGAFDPLLHEVVCSAVREAVRNAAVHGRGSQPDHALNLCIEVRREGDRLVVDVRDDGVGMSFGARPPDSGGDPSGGSGGGLVLHSTMLAISGGELVVESPANGGTRVVISAPV